MYNSYNNSAGEHTVPPFTETKRRCATCKKSFPANRPRSAALCVPCLTAAGDVPKTRRYDETMQDGEVVSIYFRKPTAYVELMLARAKSNFGKVVPNVENN